MKTITAALVLLALAAPAIARSGTNWPSIKCKPGFQVSDTDRMLCVPQAPQRRAGR